MRGWIWLNASTASSKRLWGTRRPRPTNSGSGASAPTVSGRSVPLMMMRIRLRSTPMDSSRSAVEGDTATNRRLR